jgi:SAM-dependent methyltransferase
MDMSPNSEALQMYGRVSRVGDVWYERCPICEDSRIECVWRIPFSKLKTVSDTENVILNGYAVQYLPMYGETNRVYQYYACQKCESIFLNPQTSRTKTHYSDPSNVGARRKIDKARLERTEAVWKGYIRHYQKRMKPHLPSRTKVVLDAGCGGGQYLILAREDRELHAERLIGLELSPAAVDHLQELGIEAYQCDLDESDSLGFLDSGSVDFVIFSEIFEHTFFPFRSMNQLVRTLRPGGRLYFTAQRNDRALPVRPSENQCITELGLTTIIKKLECRAVWSEGKVGKWTAVIEK